MTQFLLPLTGLGSCPQAEEVGSKAHTLCLLAKGGLPVPEAWALSYRLSDAIVSHQAQAVADVLKASKHLPFPLAVRSSASLEDNHALVAPGLFQSILDVGDKGELIEAIRAVVASGQTSLVAAYQRALHIDEPPTVAVILQRQISGTKGRGVLYTRPPGNPTDDRMILEVTGEPAIWVTRDTLQASQDSSSLQRDEIRALCGLALQAEQILGIDTGLDIEWVWGADGLWLVQGRHTVHPKEHVTTESNYLSSLLAFSKEAPDTVWTLDATHNPFPLSPAQAGLVEAVKDVAGYRMRVVGGYLYTAAGSEPLPPRNLSPSQAATVLKEQLFCSLDGLLAKAEQTPRLSVTEAVDVYREVARRYSQEIAPLVACVNESHGTGNPISTWRARANAGQMDASDFKREVAPLSWAWDVWAPTFGERPEVVESAMGCEANHVAVDTEDAPGEADDVYFFRAQALVRRALLLLADTWHVGDQIFFMPLNEVCTAQDRNEVPAGLVAKAAALRREYERQSQTKMPLRFANGSPLPCPRPSAQGLYRGFGTGGYIEGRVVRVDSMESFPSFAKGDVLVLPSISPAHALMALGAGAVVCEYGEHLGHGAAMARELDIPCVVGCARAWHELRTGDHVAVDGQRGMVARIGKGQSFPSAPSDVIVP